MSINFNEFVPRPGLVNEQGCLPDPSELVCIEVPKVFDQCLIKQCLVYKDGPDTNKTDCELRSDVLTTPKRYLGSRDFNIRLISVNKIPLKRNDKFKKIIICYVISFYADYIDCNNVNRTEFFEINRKDIIGKFYCPDSLAKTSDNTTSDNCSNNINSNIIKLEMVADALAGELVEDCSGNFFLDITLGYYIIVKCELIVQLLIPAYNYCPIPDKPCEESCENPCEIFEKTPVPKFYPDQNLKPLFPCYDNKENSTEIL